MGREIRRVPANWEHPKDEKGRYQPMYDKDFDTRLSEWLKGYELWKKGEHEYQKESDLAEGLDYWDYDGAPPDPDYYHPKWEKEPSWYQMYETVSEGTPVSPPFATKRELIDYLVKNGDFWDQHRGNGGWDRKAAQQFVEREWAPSMVMVHTDEVTEIKTPRDGI